MSKEEKIVKMRQNADIDGLIDFLQRERESIYRLDAAEALAQLGNEYGLDHLISALDDPDDELADIAREILQRLNNPHGNLALQQPRKAVSPDSPPTVNPFVGQLAGILVMVGVVLLFNAPIAGMIVLGVGIVIWYTQKGNQTQRAKSFRNLAQIGGAKKLGQWQDRPGWKIFLYIVGILLCLFEIIAVIFGN